MPAAEVTDPAAVGRAYFEAVAARDLDAMTSFWEPGTMDEIHGVVSMRAPEGIREWFGNTFRAVPDFKMEIVDLVAEGEKVAVRWQMTGTFTGEARFEGAIATGEPIELTGCDMLTVREGRIVHNDAYLNAMDMARQLGIMPPRNSGQERAMIGAVNLKTRAARLLGR
jgi:steroid delta-isomerase-like uncharacterized protein